MRFGICYYPEHWPPERWEADAQLMQQAGITLIRVAEFAWSVIQPTADQYEWQWLDDVIALFGRYGIDTMIGTPTATPPIWLTRQHPDILHVDSNLQPREHGGRKHYCPNSPTYRAHSHTIVTKMVERYGQHPHVVGWQIDNEFGESNSARCYCTHCEAAFHQWLRERYSAIATLNEAWGAVFWSQTYSEWAQIPLPSDNNPRPNPSHKLDYYRFASDSFVSYQAEQIAILRTHAPHHVVTHNYMGLFPELDCFDLARPLDFAAWDNYPTGFPDQWRDMIDDTQANYAYDVGDPGVMGLAHALMYGLKQRPYWVMEQQCGHINWGKMNPRSRPGTPRLWTWHAVAEGADTIVYFRWRATVLAHENYHSGLLKQDGTPDVGYRDLLMLQQERALLDETAAQPNAAAVAILFSYDDLWAQELQPHRHDWHYLQAIYNWYDALRRQGINVHLVNDTADLAPYSTLIAPSAHIVTDPLVAKLTEYAQKGGTVILGVRSGFKTESNRVTERPLPGQLRDLVGATVVDWSPLPDNVTVTLSCNILSGTAGYWLEHLETETAEAVATTADGTVLTRNQVGDGQLFYVGWWPTSGQIQDLMAHLGVTSDVLLPAGVVHKRRGERSILLNFTDQVQVVHLGDRVVSIAPRDVAVVTR